MSFIKKLLGIGGGYPRPEVEPGVWWMRACEVRPGATVRDGLVWRTVERSIGDEGQWRLDFDGEVPRYYHPNAPLAVR